MYENSKTSRLLTFLPPKTQDQQRKTASSQPAGIASAYLDECESLRGVAILLVVLFHSYLQLPPNLRATPNLFNAFIIAGNTGVTLFFVLSSFLLNLPFMAGRPIKTKTFFIKRALRILPMYGAVVIIGGIYNRDLAAAIKSLLFWDIELSTLWPFGSVWWSLVAEIQFYLLLPGLHMLWRSPRLKWLLLPIFLSGCYFYVHISRTLDASHYFIHSPRNSILALWPAFLCGAILSAIHAQFGVRIKAYCKNSPLFLRGGADIVFCVLILILSLELLKDAKLGAIAAHLSYFDHVAIEAFIWSTIVAAILYLPAKAKILLTNPILGFLGLISYSLYLLHFPVMFFGEKFLLRSDYIALNFSKIEIIGICIAAGIALSTITYYLIEKPLLDFKARYAAKNTSRHAT